MSTDESKNIMTKLIKALFFRKDEIIIIIPQVIIPIAKGIIFSANHSPMNNPPELKEK